MAFCRLNDVTVVSATIVLPRIGIWHADITADTENPIAGQVTLGLGDGALAYRGTILRGDVFRAKYRARIVGGAAGLGHPLDPKFYRGAPLRLPLQDVLDACSERLDPTSDPTILGRVLRTWSRRRGSGADALADLFKEVGAAFRFSPDGSLWVGNDSFPDLTFDHSLLAEDPADARVEIASEVPKLVPGVTFLGRRVSAVVHAIDPDHVRTVAWFEKASATNSDRLKGGLTAFVRNAVPELDFLRPYPARVVQQDDDGTLHLQPDSDAMPGLTGVPIRYGVPGVRAKVPAGARCTIEFEHGDPTSPVVTSFEPGALLELALDDGTHAVAREGDRVVCGGLSFAVDPTGHVLTIEYAPPAGLPQIVTLTIPSGVAATGSIDLAGMIAEGAPKIRA